MIPFFYYYDNTVTKMESSNLANEQISVEKLVELLEMREKAVHKREREEIHKNKNKELKKLIHNVITDEITKFTIDSDAVCCSFMIDPVKLIGYDVSNMSVKIILKEISKEFDIHGYKLTFLSPHEFCLMCSSTAWKIVIRKRTIVESAESFVDAYLENPDIFSKSPAFKLAEFEYDSHLESKVKSHVKKLCYEKGLQKSNPVEKSWLEKMFG